MSSGNPCCVVRSQADENGYRPTFGGQPTFQTDPYWRDNTVCIHEEDFGMLWKHWDIASDTTEVRRSRRLVVMTAWGRGPRTSPPRRAA